MKDEENLDQAEHYQKDIIGGDDYEEEENLNEDGLRITVEKKLTATSEIDLNADNRMVVGAVQKKDGVADESTRRDINFTATGLSYRITDETN